MAASLANNEEDQKQLYYKILEQFSKNVTPDKLMKQNWMNMMIERIESATKVIQNDSIDNLHPRVKEALKKYFVAKVENPDGTGVPQKKLFVIQPNSKSYQTVPLTDTFPIVMKAHLMTDHGGIDAMQEWIFNSNLVVASTCFPTILQVCLGCEAASQNLKSNNGTTNLESELATSSNLESELNAPSESTQTAPPNMQSELLINKSLKKPSKTTINKEKIWDKRKVSGLIEILSMSGHALHDKLDHLLIYQDMSTNFLQLRPIGSRDLVESTANELMHIFADMGPPDFLIVPMNLKDLGARILDTLNQIFDHKIETFILEELPADLGSKKVCALVSAAINNWLAQATDSKWCIGCHIVQWELNNILKVNGKSPFEKLLGLKSNAEKSQDSKLLELIGNLNIEQSNRQEIDDFISENPVLEFPINELL